MLVSLLYVRTCMRKKPAKKAKVGRAKKAALSQEAVPVAPTIAAQNPVAWPIITEGPNGEPLAMPPPEELFREAEQELNYRDLSHYTDTIRILREKGFSYRDIAEWLSERGVPVDHNAVYRVFTNSLSDYDAHLESERVDEEAQEEACGIVRHESRQPNAE